MEGGETVLVSLSYWYTEKRVPIALIPYNLGITRFGPTMLSNCSRIRSSAFARVEISSRWKTGLRSMKNMGVMNFLYRMMNLVVKSAEPRVVGAL